MTLKTPAILTLILCAHLIGASEAATVSGMVIGADEAPIIDVSVFLCEQDSGIPLSPTTMRPFTETEQFPQSGLVVSITDERGAFTFPDVPEGAYRLIAQSWLEKSEVVDPFDKNGEEVLLHGILNSIEVDSNDIEQLEVRPLGTGILVLDEDLSGILMVISTEPVRADPILWFAGWTGPFLQNVIGASRMSSGKTTFYGLPEGTIHIALFAYDNNGGCGAGEAIVSKGQETEADYIPIVCGWSNGQHDPPEELLPVFEEFKVLLADGSFSYASFLTDHGIPLEAAAGRGVSGLGDLIQHLDTEVRVPSGTVVRFADVQAAVNYVELQRYVARRKNGER